MTTSDRVNQNASIIEEHDAIFLVNTSTPSGLIMTPVFNEEELDLGISDGDLIELYRSVHPIKNKCFFEIDDCELALFNPKVILSESSFNLYQAIKTTISLAQLLSLNALEKQGAFTSLVIDDTYIASFVDAAGFNNVVPVGSIEEAYNYQLLENYKINEDYPVRVFINGNILPFAKG